MGDALLSFFHFDITRSATIFVNISLFHAGVLFFVFKLSKGTIKRVKKQEKYIHLYLFLYTLISGLGILSIMIDIFIVSRPLDLEYLFAIISIFSIFIINLVILGVSKYLLVRPDTMPDPIPVFIVGTAVGGGPGGSPPPQPSE